MTGDANLSAAQRMSDVVFEGLVKRQKLELRLPSTVIAATLGALAGHACQVAAVAGVTTRAPQYAGKSLVTVDGRNGDRYYYGDAVNFTSLEWQYSTWALVAGVAQRLGRPLPDVNELVGHVAASVGGATFGIPRDLPAGAPAPRSLLSLWQLGEALAKDVTHPDYVPVVFGLAYQRLVQTDHAVDPSVDVDALARVMLESTVAMSKLIVTPAELGAPAAAS